ncbi:MAG: 4-hydroxymandelate oxidase [Gammaproteobacteria bacterium]|jgi:4-hydroxymandelate oxidase
MNDEFKLSTRRAFLRYLAASPALCAASRVMGQPAFDILDPYAPQLITRVQDAINVFDFHEAAKQKYRPGHYTYMSMGTDNGGTLQANRDGFKKYNLRMRRLINTRVVDTSVELFGVRYPTPIIIAPCGHQKAFHPQGEIPVALAAQSHDAEMILSTVTSLGVESVNAARGRPVWYQLYVDENWETTRGIVKRVEDAGCPVLAITVDLPISNREADTRHHRATNPECQSCHGTNAGVIPPKPMFEGLKRTFSDRTFLNWNFVDRIRDNTSMKLILKGIVTKEDALLAIEHGIDGVIVSNHGGRAEDSGRSTIESLPEVVAAIDGRIPVIMDSGIRRGTDIFKALALGADAIAIGRPYLWGLGTFGQEGVETVLDILERELEIIMKQAGTLSISDINRSYIA